MSEKTRMIFRKFPEGDVIALMPDNWADYRNHYISSYQHIGQHGGAHPNLIYELARATPAEYAELLNELTKIGYDVWIDNGLGDGYGLIEEIIARFPEFLTDEPVNGGDLVDFIGDIVRDYEKNRPKGV